MKQLRLKGISKWFGSFQALKGIGMTVSAGELVSLLGPSGCGKSTLFRIIAGLERAGEGEIWLDDCNFGCISPQKRKVGMVFQNYALFPNLTALGNISFGLEVQGMEREKARNEARCWLEKVGLASLEKRYPHELSGGQQQRVALARALAPKPEILLLDEPLSALDASVRTILRNEIRQIQQELGITTIYVTHDQAEALAMSDRIAVMKNGEIVEMATPQNLYRNPANLFTAEFIGTASRFDGPLLSVSPPVGQFGRFTLLLPGLTYSVQPGMPVTVMIRAESVGLAGDISGDRDMTMLQGTVQMNNFMGNIVRCNVGLFQGGTMLVDLPAEDERIFKVGEKIDIKVPPEACLVYDSKSGSSLLRGVPQAREIIKPAV
ncbi:ABC transporter ATP-binding protein [Candidatus Formimonas warabiya]|uniref:ABC-type quaternary amine transporter n=1 Tax=Formimonas warabiya TaxID=1761012 RepID=A0A3G1KSL5_FORW1|nr:ABC transporter ATP-binding protein [Candidatus Formimonas warabiya]ATW25420.1 hypothetical protein DCMF_12125 [Candidatus Formimonas warabiya]